MKKSALVFAAALGLVLFGGCSGESDGERDEDRDEKTVARKSGREIKKLATEIGNNGRSIVNAIMQTNTDREACAMSDIWPRVTASRFHTYTGGDSNQYFWWLFSKELVTGIGFSDLAGGGVEPAKDLERLREGAGNVWTVLACDSSLPVVAPFMWTRNLKIDENDLMAFDKDSPKDWSDKLDPDAEPFGDSCVVVIRRNGAMNVIKLEDLTDSAFLLNVGLPDVPVRIMRAAE